MSSANLSMSMTTSSLPSGPAPESRHGLRRASTSTAGSVHAPVVFEVRQQAAPLQFGRNLLPEQIHRLVEGRVAVSGHPEDFPGADHMIGKFDKNLRATEQPVVEIHLRHRPCGPASPSSVRPASGAGGCGSWYR